jgi:hypothetical protein
VSRSSSGQLRILFVVLRAITTGGAERELALVARSHEVHVAVLYGSKRSSATAALL